MRKPAIIRIQDFDSSRYSTGYSGFEPFGYTIRNSDREQVFHVVDDHEVRNSDVVGFEDLKAVVIGGNKADSSKCLIGNDIVKCDVTNVMNFVDEIPIYAFGRYWDSIDQYSLEFRGAVSDSICGGWRKKSVRTSFLFDTKLGACLDSNIFRFTSDLDNLRDCSVLPEESIASRYLAPDTQTEVVEIRWSEQQFTDMKRKSDCVLRIS